VLEIDDAEATDILTHLPGTTAWIQEALARANANANANANAGDDDNGNNNDSAEQTRHADIPEDAPPSNPGGVLVHCQAGMSRSATVVAAYLMRTLDLDPVEAVSFLRERRPVVDPSETFWHQLGLYYRADGRVTLKDRSTRQWYLERTTGEVMSESFCHGRVRVVRFVHTCMHTCIRAWLGTATPVPRLHSGSIPTEPRNETRCYPYLHSKP
jgi:dual specificity phosphatase 12